MAKFKPKGSKKAQAAGSGRGVIPCAIIVLLGMTFMFWLLYEMMKSGK
jgi:hypothetical protein